MKDNDHINEVEWAISRVIIVHGSSDATGNVLRWVIWDRNLDTNESQGWAWIGPEVNLEEDKLDNPPFSVSSAFQRQRAKAAYDCAISHFTPQSQ